MMDSLAVYDNNYYSQTVQSSSKTKHVYLLHSCEGGTHTTATLVHIEIGVDPILMSFALTRLSTLICIMLNISKLLLVFVRIFNSCWIWNWSNLQYRMQSSEAWYPRRRVGQTLQHEKPGFWSFRKWINAFDCYEYNFGFLRKYINWHEYYYVH